MSKIFNLIKLVVNAKKAIPPIKGNHQLEGIKQNTEILWDKWGIPHIFAQNIEDAYFTQGLIHAQYRLFQMDLFRRRFSGRLSEIFGEKALDWDKYVRTIGLNRVAKKGADRIKKDPNSKSFQILSAYCSGVNKGIEQAKIHPPMEFETLEYIPDPWKIEDVLLLISVLDWMESYNQETEILREMLIEKLGIEEANKIYPIHKGGKDGSSIGSNAWLFDSSRTNIQKNILANDPHLAFSQPILWFITHIHCPDSNIIGVTLPGNPCIIIGHNENIGWGITNCISDNQDLFKMIINPENPNQYKYENNWIDFEIIDEPINVKDLNEKVDYKVKISKFGPIISYFEIGHEFLKINLKGTYALKWTGHDTESDISSISYLNLNNAKSWDEYRNCLKGVSVVAHNFFYADKEGNIGHQVAGQLPLRKKDISGLPYTGDRDENNWNGIVPFERLPFIYNPENGAIFNANYNPDKIQNGVVIKTDDVKEYRYLRLKEITESQKVFSIKDIERDQFDTKSKQAEIILPTMLEIIRGNLSDKVLLDAGRALSDWDYCMSEDSIGAVIFKLWYLNTIKAILKRKVDLEIYETFISNNPFSLRYLYQQYKSEKKMLIEVTLEGLYETVDYLKQKLGDNVSNWKWGKIHTITLEHPFTMASDSAKIFNIGPYPVGGDRNTVNNGHIAPLHDYKMVTGPSLRQILIPQDWDSSLMCMPGGQSGLVFHKHYKDLIKYWVKGEHFPYLFSRSRIEENLEGKLTYSPK